MSLTSRRRAIIGGHRTKSPFASFNRSNNLSAELTKHSRRRWERASSLRRSLFRYFRSHLNETTSVLSSKCLFLSPREVNNLQLQPSSKPNNNFHFVSNFSFL
ncbi:MAG: hypothetical protein ACTS42_00850 [Candidatus Hodgkinia cicadicola]